MFYYGFLRHLFSDSLITYGYLKAMKNLFFLLLIVFICAAFIPKENTNRGYIVEVGDKSPKIKKMMLDDGSLTGSKDWKGKVVMLQFTASWCGVCIKEMPHIEEEVWQEWKDDGLVVIGVDRDEPLETVLKFKEKTGVSYPLALDPGAKIFQKFAEEKAGVTRNIIIDKKGKIAFLTRLYDPVEFEEMKKVIESLL